MAENEKNDYMEDVKVDPEQLDVMWLNQASLYVHYATIAVNARDVRDRAKQKRDVTRAEVEKDCRAHPEKYGVEKVTEAAIASAVNSDKDLATCIDEYQNACLEADLSQVAVSGMEQRKSALENLVRLHAASYFAGPQEPRDLPAAQREFIQKSHSEKGKEVARTMSRNSLNK